MPLTVDTLNIYSRLKSTGLSEESARAIAEIFREAIEENLANKKDLKTTETNLTKYIGIVQKVRHEIFLNNNLIKSRSLSMVKVDIEKPKERDRDGTRNSYNTSVQFGNR